MDHVISRVRNRTNVAVHIFGRLTMGERGGDERIPLPACIVVGAQTFLVDPISSTDAMIGQVDRALLQLDRYQRGDLVVIVAGRRRTQAGPPTLSTYTASAI